MTTEPCYICHSGEYVESDVYLPFSICKCNITVHKSCLKEWMQHTQNNKCTICKNNYTNVELYESIHYVMLSDEERRRFADRPLQTITSPAPSFGRCTISEVERFLFDFSNRNPVPVHARVTRIESKPYRRGRRKFRGEK